MRNPEMLIEQARALVDERISELALDVLDSDVWNELRFEDGWVLVSLREGILGARHFIVMDEGEVHFENGSLPSNFYVEQHSQAGSDATLTLINRRILRTGQSE